MRSGFLPEGHEHFASSAACSLPPCKIARKRGRFNTPMMPQVWNSRWTWPVLVSSIRETVSRLFRLLEDNIYGGYTSRALDCGLTFPSTVQVFLSPRSVAYRHGFRYSFSCCACAFFTTHPRLQFPCKLPIASSSWRTTNEEGRGQSGARLGLQDIFRLAHNTARYVG